MCRGLNTTANPNCFPIAASPRRDFVNEGNEGS